MSTTTANPSVTAQAAELAIEAEVVRGKVLALWSGATRFHETLEGGWACQYLAEAYHAADHAAFGLARVSELKQDSPTPLASVALELARLEGRMSALTTRLLDDQAAVCRVARRLLRFEGYLRANELTDEQILRVDAHPDLSAAIRFAKELIGLAACPTEAAGALPKEGSLSHE